MVRRRRQAFQAWQHPDQSAQHQHDVHRRQTDRFCRLGGYAQLQGWYGAFPRAGDDRERIAGCGQYNSVRQFVVSAEPDPHGPDVHHRTRPDDDGDRVEV